MVNHEVQVSEGEAGEKPRNKDFDYLAHVVGASVIIGALIISGVLYFNFKMLFDRLSSGDFAQAQTAQTQVAGSAATAGTPAPALVDVTVKPNTPYLGGANAKVTVIEFADYQCPYCEQFYKTVMPDIVSKYIKTGQIKFIYQDFAFLSADSNTAAEASHCAEDQNKFWQYHDYLFSNQGEERSGWADAAHQKLIAATPALGLNVSQFDQCLDSGKYKQEVLDETAAGQKFGVSGTPSIFILKGGNDQVDTAYIQNQFQLHPQTTTVALPNGNTFIVGALPPSNFEQIVDAALKN